MPKYLTHLSLTVVLLMCGLKVYAQNGVWYADNTDGSDIDTDWYASPAWYAGPPACPRNITSWSNLNGVFQSANANYPNTSSIFQQVLSAGTGEYPWTREWAQYGTLNHGYCGVIYNSVIQAYLSIAITTGQTVSDDGHGNCGTIPDCAPGVVPLCPQVNPQRWTVVEGASPCDPFHYSYWLTYRTSKSAPKSCVNVGFSQPIPYGPGACTTQ